MWPIALAQREVHAELRIELRELMQAGKLLICAHPRPDVERNALLMSGGASLDVAPPFLALDDTRPAGARASLAVAHARLLRHRSVRRRDGDMAVHINERAQKRCGRGGEGR